jgi:hypothetical protein
MFSKSLILYVIFMIKIYEAQQNQLTNRLTNAQIKEIFTKYSNFQQNFKQIYENYNKRKQIQPMLINSSFQCKDPSEELMIIYHLDMINFFKEFIGILNLKEVKQIFKDIILKSNDSKNDSKSLTECPQKIISLKPTGLCDSQILLHTRSHLYPAIRNQVKCICDVCLKIKQDDIVFRCKPVEILMPALMRDSSRCIEGVYDWKHVLEYVSVACECLPVRIQNDMEDNKI